MAKYATLKAAVEAAIRTNGQQQITGQVLQTQLVNMITSLGKYFQSFGGLATPAGSFTAGDESVTFLAVEAGTYTNFGGAVLDGKTLHVLAYDGDWADVDTLIPSGAAFEAALALAIKGAQSGIAEGIADTISAGTAQEFLQRQSGGDGVNCLKRIKGKTIVVNNVGKVTYGNISHVDVDYTYISSSKYKLNGTASGYYDFILNSSYSDLPTFSAGHKLLVVVPAGLSGITHVYALNGTYVTYAKYTETTIITVPATWNEIQQKVSVAEGASYSNKEFESTLVDLTLAGLDSLTLAQILSLYPNGFGAYNAGVLKSNDAAALLTDGFNQWDEEWEVGTIDNDGQPASSDSVIRSKNFIPVFPNTDYYKKSSIASPTDTHLLQYYYDADKNFISAGAWGPTFTTPANCHFVKFKGDTTYGTTYKNDICINLSWSGYRNGEYEPYWQRVLALRLSELTGIPEGGTEADRVTMFPNGLGGAGSAFDSIFVENGVTKARKTMTEEIDLGDLNYDYNADYKYFYATLQGKKEGVDNLICPKFALTTLPLDGNQPDKSIKGGSTNTRIFISDFAYTSASAFKAAMAGVKLIAEAATPIVYTDLQYADGTPFTMPATILVDNYGTERIQAPEGATTPSAPFCCDSNYSIGVANLVKRLAALENAE